MPKHEKIGSGNDARCIRRDDEGKFTTNQVDVGRSLSADRRRKAKNTAKPGQGDRGDRKNCLSHARTPYWRVRNLPLDGLKP